MDKILQNIPDTPSTADNKMPTGSSTPPLQDVPGSETGGKCNILNSFRLNTIYTASYSGFGHTLDLSFTPNEDGTLRVTKAVSDGADFTQEALNHGGNAVIATYSQKYGKDCRQYDYRLCWELSGDFITFMEKIATVSDFLIYANYNGNGNGYLYFFKVTWHWSSPISH